MMQKDKDDDNKLQKMIYAKYHDVKGGIFSHVSRRRMLGSKLSKRYRTENIFWSEMAKYLKPALLDLELFATKAENKFVDEALNRDTMEPVIRALLPISDPKPDKVKAELAQSFIMIGFEYLLHWPVNPESGYPEPLRKSIENAEEISNYLVKLLGGEPRFVSSTTLEKMRM